MAERKRTAPKKNVAAIAGVFVVGMIVTVGSVMWGKSDAGQIDVSAAISSSNQIQQESNNPGGIVQPVSDAFANTPNGGLVAQPQGDTPPPEPAPIVDTGTTTASSTPSENTEEESSRDAASATEGDTDTTEASSDAETAATDITAAQDAGVPN